jgi:hypothetical protein
MLPKFLAGALALTFVLAAAGPADAFSGPGGFGSRVRCYNRTIAGSPTGQYWEWGLRRLYVTAPLFAALDEGQGVGWRFIVQRKVGDGAWSVRYRSPIAKGNASADGTVDLSPMDVGVTVPPDAFNAFYRVVVKVYWFRPNGSTQTTAKQGLNEYRVWIDGQFRWKQGGFCEGRAGFAV